MVLIMDFEALYAGLPGGFVIPCLLPVMMIGAGSVVFWTNGKKSCEAVD